MSEAPDWIKCPHCGHWQLGPMVAGEQCEKCDKAVKPLPAMDICFKWPGWFEIGLEDALSESE